jgi:hypothetical protein
MIRFTIYQFFLEWFLLGPEHHNVINKRFILEKIKHKHKIKNNTSAIYMYIYYILILIHYYYYFYYYLIYSIINELSCCFPCADYHVAWSHFST